MPTRRRFIATGATLLGASRLVRAADLSPARVPDAPNQNLALFEPKEGCYIGAFILRESRVTNIRDFELLTQKKHASYFTYVGYGKPFPQAWVRTVAAAKAAPQIAFEPNDGLKLVVDNAYLRSWARDAARTKIPIFLRWASEMNGDWAQKRYGGTARDYKEKFALVSRIMKKEAPNVAMVWTPFSSPTDNIASYYPGDEWVDWVGVNVYSVYVHDGDPNRPAFQEDPVEFLRFIYDGYAARKPVHVSEYAATIYCKGTKEDTLEFAKEKARRFYGAIRDQFPRVKAVNWFSVDTVGAGLANNNYSLFAKINGRSLLSTYSEIVADKHFLSHVDFEPTPWNRPVPSGTTIVPGQDYYGDLTDDALLNNEAIVSIIDRPFLRGVKNGDVITDDFKLILLIPRGIEIKGIFWKIDGSTIDITGGNKNKMTGSLMQRIIPYARFVEGEHTASVTITLPDDRRYDTNAITFTLA